MEVILLEKINKLGELGDVVRVKSGYGRNYLVPQKKAVLASSEAIQDIELHRVELQQAEDEKRKAIEELKKGDPAIAETKAMSLSPNVVSNTSSLKLEKYFEKLKLFTTENIMLYWFNDKTLILSYTIFISFLDWKLESNKVNFIKSFATLAGGKNEVWIWSELDNL